MEDVYELYQVPQNVRDIIESHWRLELESIHEILSRCINRNIQIRFARMQCLLEDGVVRMLSGQWGTFDVLIRKIIPIEYLVAPVCFGLYTPFGNDLRPL